MGFLRDGHPHQAAMLLGRAKLIEPDKASIREALGRALFMSGRTARARREFAKVVQIEPASDYARAALACERTGQRTRAIGTSSSRSPCAPGRGLRARLERLAVMLADRYGCILFDLDGVLYRGEDAAPGLPMAELRRRGVRPVFLTNNSSRTPRQVADKLRAIGIEADPDEVVTSALATAELLAEREGDARS